MMAASRRVTMAVLTCILLLGLAYRAARADGLPRKASLGVAIGPVSPEQQQKLGLAAGQGAAVIRTFPRSDGGRPALAVGDVIVKFEGAPIAPAALISAVQALPVGRPVRLEVWRDGRRKELRITLAEKPRDPGTADYAVIYSDVVSSGHRMRTLISQPRTPGRHPAVLFIQGYSPISYDYFLDGPGLDAPILLDLARHGFVTLRVDKPGVGDSEGGPFAEVDFTKELDIYRQALLQLRGLAFVDTDNVFIFGHSMGGAFGPVLASEIPVKGMAMYGIASRTWHEYLLDTLRYQGLLAGKSYAAVDEDVRQGSRAMELVFQDHLTPEQVKEQHPELAATVDSTFSGGLFFGRTAKFWEQLEDTNFADYWSRSNTHVLVVHGASDFVSYRVDHQLVADIVNRAHPGWGIAAEEPNSDHLFSNWATEAESLEHFPRGTFNPAFITRLEQWMRGVMTAGD